MTLLKAKLSCLIGLASLSLLIGVVAMANASDLPNSSKWITIKNLEEKVEVSFPRKPLELKFTPTFKGILSKLHLYSVPLKKGLLVLSTLESPLINENALTPPEFKRNFDSYLIKYLFHEPHFFQRNQTFESSADRFEPFPLLSFQFTYQNDQTLQLLKGVAIVHDHTLYQIFYLAPAKEYNHDILKKFVGSFNFTAH